MSIADAKKVLLRMKDDEEFRRKVTSVKKDIAFGIMKEAGYDVTLECIIAAQKELADELSEEDLGKVAGGSCCMTNTCQRVLMDCTLAEVFLSYMQPY